MFGATQRPQRVGSVQKQPLLGCCRGITMCLCCRIPLLCLLLIPPGLLGAGVHAGHQREARQLHQGMRQVRRLFRVQRRIPRLIPGDVQKQPQLPPPSQPQLQ